MNILMITGEDPGPIRESYPELEVVSGEDSARIRERLPRAAGVIIERAAFGPAEFDAARECLAVVIAGPASSAKVRLEKARAPGIMVASIPDFATEEIAAAVTARILRFADEAGRARPEAAHRPLRLGMIGLGQVARAVSRSVMHPVGDPAAAGSETVGTPLAGGTPRFEIRAHDPFVPPEPFRQLQVAHASLPDLLSASDLVSVQCSFAPSLRGMIGAEELALMKPGAGLLSVSHPAVIDEDAARRSVRPGHLSLFERIEGEWGGLPSVRLRTVRRAMNIIDGCARGEQPPHLLIDPAFPRIFTGTGAGAGGRCS